MKSKQYHFRNGDCGQGIWDALPMGISLTIFGSIFGIVAIQTGLTPIESLALCLRKIVDENRLELLIDQLLISVNQSIESNFERQTFCNFPFCGGGKFFSVLCRSLSTNNIRRGSKRY
jgi:hypothetical protein